MKDSDIMQQCFKCGGNKFKYGRVVKASIYGGLGPVYFQAQSDKLHNGKISVVFASVCLNCGNLETYIDPKSIQRRD